MTVLVLASLLYSFRLVPGLLLPEKPPPHAYIAFAQTDTLKKWTSLLTITTVRKARYQVRLEYGPKANFDEDTVHHLLAANWLVAMSFEPVSIRVFGVRAPGGEVDAIESITILNHRVDGSVQCQRLFSRGGIKVQTKNVDGKTRPALEEKPLPTGPDIRNEAYVEFDLSSLPTVLAGVSWYVNFHVFAPQDGEYDIDPDVSIGETVDASKPLDCATGVLESLSSASCKAELIGLTKPRVYGRVVGGRYFPVHRGKVESEDLHPEELPKVKNAGSSRLLAIARACARRVYDCHEGPRKTARSARRHHLGRGGVRRGTGGGRGQRRPARA